MKIRLDLCYRINIFWDFISIAEKREEIFATDRAMQGQDVSVKVNQLMKMKDVKVLAHCLLLDDVKLDHKQISANLYTIVTLE